MTLDFLPPGGGEPHGYDEFMATVDALVIGRKTFETVLTFEQWPYGEKSRCRAQHSPARPAPLGAAVERMSGTPAEIAVATDGSRHPARLRGWRDHDYSGFLQDGLIQRLVITRVPVLIRCRDSALWPCAAATSCFSHVGGTRQVPAASSRVSMRLSGWFLELCSPVVDAMQPRRKL